MAQTVKITPATGLLEFIGDNVANKPVLQHDNAGNLTLTLQATKKFTIGGNLKVNGKVTMVQQTLTDNAAITWDFNNGANAKVTLGGNRTLVISNIETGDTGLLLVTQDGTGGRTLTLPNGSAIVGGGSYVPTATAGATDVIGVYFDGTTYWWTIGYNTVTPPLTSVGISGSDFVISNSPLTANGIIGLALATVNSNVGTFGSASAVPVITVNGKGLITAVSTTNISIPTNLDSLTDVTITSPATSQLLRYNGSQWVNWTPNYITGITSGDVTTALGYTPVPNTRTLSINGITYDLSANRAWTINTVSYTSRLQHQVKAGENINKGQAVYVTSADGTNMIVSKASNTSDMTSARTMGLIDATVPTNGFANVVTEGLLAGLDTTQGTEGDPVWLGANGDLLYGFANKPHAPIHLVFIGIVTRRNQNNGEIFVKVQNGFELEELHDVDLITTVPVNGHILGYDGTLWVNKTIAQWLGFTPADDSTVVHKTGNETIAGIKTFSNTTQSTSISSGAIVTSGGAGIAKNLYVGGDLNVAGNLTIGGTTTTVNAQNLTVSDNMIYLNNGILTNITNVVGNGSTVVYTTQEAHNYVTGMSVTITGVTPSAYNLSNQTITAVSTNSFTIANSATGTYSSGGTARAKSNANPDLGFAGGYNDGSYAHAGLFRDATDNTWKFFKGYTPEPDASPFIDTAHASFAYADLRAYNITGNSFVKVGGTSSQFLKADGSVDSNTYLTSGSASSLYALDANVVHRTGNETVAGIKTFTDNMFVSPASNPAQFMLSGTNPEMYIHATAGTSRFFINRASTGNQATLMFTTAMNVVQNNAWDSSGSPLWTLGMTNNNNADSFKLAYGDIWDPNSVALEITSGMVAYFRSVPYAGGNLLATQAWVQAGYVPTGRTITINGTSYDLSANRSWTITAGVSSVSAGTGISVNSTTGAVTVTNTGLLSATAGTGITVSTSNQNVTINTTALLSATAGTGITVSTLNQNVTINTTALLSATAGTGITVSTLNQNLTINTTALLSATAGTGISVSTLNQNLTINNTGLLSATAGTGISVSTLNQNLTINNTGLLSAAAGSGITVSTSNQQVTITNTGILSVAAGSGISVSTANGTSTITSTDTLATVTSRGASTSTAVTFNGNVTLGNNADLTFVDLAGTFPTSGKGFDWTLNNDGARIYAIQPSSDSIDFVFQLRDNATTNDRFVFWVDDYQGPAFDKYPLIIRGGTEFDLVSSALYTNGTLRLSNAGVLQNVTGNISMFTNNAGYITSAALAPYVPYTGANSTVNLGVNEFKAGSVFVEGTDPVTGGAIRIKQYTGSEANLDGYSTISTLRTGVFYFTASTTPPNFKSFQLDPSALTENTLRSYVLPNASGTLALTSDIPTNLNQLVNGPGYITTASLSGYATQVYVNTQISNLVNGAPALLDTLDELAAALGDDANFATTITNSIAGKVAKAGDTMTGELVFSMSAPQIRFADTDHYDHWIHVNSNRFYILSDRNGDGAWETPYPLELNSENNTGYIFGNVAIHSGNIGSYALTSLPAHNHDGVYVPINPDGDGPAWSYADNNPTINGKYVGGGQRFGADGDNLTGGFLQARHLNAYDGHVNSSDGYYVGVIEYGSIPGIYNTTQVIDSSGRWTGVAIADNKIASSANWNTAYGWGNHASAGYAQDSAVVKLAGDQTITGQKTFPSAISNRPILGGGFLSALSSDGNYDMWGISEDYYPSHPTASSAWGIQWNGDNNEVRFIGAGSQRLVIDLDGANNGLTWNGNTVWHAGNDGSGSGLDADLLDGYHASGSASANTVVIRDVNGYIYANYINTNVGVDNPSIANFITDNGDGWMRKSSIAHVRNSLGNYGGWLTQAAADPLYVNVTGDSMTGPLVITGTTSGQELFAVNGVNGRLFTVTDDLSNSLFSVNTIAGLPVIEAFANNTVKLGPFASPVTIDSTGNLTLKAVGSFNNIKLHTEDDNSWVSQTKSDGTEVGRMGFDGFSSSNAYYSEFTVSTRSSADAGLVRRIYINNSRALALENLTGFTYNGANVATQTWVQSQGYLTSVSDVYVNTSGDTMTGALRFNESGYGRIAFTDNYHGMILRGIPNDAAGNITATDVTTLIQHSGDFRFYRTNGSINELYFQVNASGVNWRGNTVWHSGNDGVGSGLDADLLDGFASSTGATANTIALRDSGGDLYARYMFAVHFNQSGGNSENPTIGQIWTQNTTDNYVRKSTPAHFRSQIIDGYYIKLNTDTTTSGKLTLTYNTNADPLSALEIRGGGTHTGIYINPQPNAQAHVRFGSENTLRWQIRAPFQDGIDTSLKIYSWVTNDDVFVFDHDGTLTLDNRLIELSSIRYKTQVESLTPALDKVMHLRPITYVKIGGTGEKEIGLIAEEVAEIYPELIKYNEEGQVDGINYTRIAPILIKTIQEQQDLIKKLTKRIDDLENR